MSLPPEIIDLIIDFIDDNRTLRVCSRVAKTWIPRSRTRIFRKVILYSHLRWYKIMSVGDTSPARYTRVLTLAEGSDAWINTDNFSRLFHHLKDFQNVEELTLNGWEPSEFSEAALKKYFSHFGERLRSLTLSGYTMGPDSLLVLLGLFPNLEDLYLKHQIIGDGTNRVLALSPKLSGRLTMRIRNGDSFPALCKLPLRFREICLYDHHYDYQGLIDACAGTLVDFRAVSLAPCE